MIILKILLLGTTLSIGIIYLFQKKTFLFRGMNNAVIYFASSNSSYMTGANMFIFSGILIASYFPVTRVDEVSFYTYFMNSMVHLIYSASWAVYSFKHRRKPVRRLLALHLIQTILSFSLWYFSDRIIPGGIETVQNHSMVQSVFGWLWAAAFFPLVFWHLYACFGMNWKKWLSGLPDNVFREAALVFIVLAFAFLQFIFLFIYLLVHLPYTGAYFLLLNILLIGFGIFDITMWLRLSPGTGYFRKFKRIFFSVFLIQFVICLINFSIGLHNI